MQRLLSKRAYTLLLYGITYGLLVTAPACQKAAPIQSLPAAVPGDDQEDAEESDEEASATGQSGEKGGGQANIPRTVGIFYAAGQQHNWECTDNCNEDQYPKTYGLGNSWGKPAIGFYDPRDTAVIDQHAEWLADAGVDYIVYDLTNNLNSAYACDLDGGLPCWRAGWKHCEREWHQSTGNNPPWGSWNHCSVGEIDDSFKAFVDRMVWRKQHGLKYVQVTAAVGIEGHCHELYPGAGMTKIFNLIKARYTDNPTYRGVWLHRNNKPFLMAWLGGCGLADNWGHDTPPPFTNDDFEWRYLDTALSGRNLVVDKNIGDFRSVWRMWSLFELEEPELAYTVNGSVPEQMTVSPARRQPDGSWGPCKDDGQVFRNDFALAHKRGVETLLVSLWNFWAKGEEQSSNCSFTIEPEEGGYGYKFLGIMKEEIAKFKAGAGQPAQPNSGANTKRIIAAHSKQCVTFDTSNKGDGAELFQAACRKGNHQKWQIVERGQGYVSFVNVRSKKCIDNRFDKDPGGRLNTWACGMTNSAQQFRLIPAGGDLYRIESKEGGLSFEVAGNSMQKRARLHQWPANGGKNQLFRLINTQ